jgi:hypothetical protein
VNEAGDFTGGVANKPELFRFAAVFADEPEDVTAVGTLRNYGRPFASVSEKILASGENGLTRITPPKIVIWFDTKS